MRDQPAGTVTMLFTDIEGSTRLLERLGQKRYAEALELHRRLLRNAFEEQGGYEVDAEGDAFFVAFSRAADAVAAASRAQHALARAEWPEGEEIRVRMGIHTGEPLVVAPKYVGLEVHKTARIMAAGHGGQVLISETTKTLVPEIDVMDLGKHRLKDLLQPESLYQLHVAEQTSEFPALKTLENRPTNLPVQPNALIGREAEVAEVARSLSSGIVRLLTLTGPGGTGKTRLALQAAAELTDAFAAGVFFVSLAPIRDPALVVTTIAQTLSVREVSAEALERTLVAYLNQKEMLLVLDNFEHVVDAAASVAELLASCPRLSVLATSRERLRIGGEQVYPVAPLRLPAKQDAIADSMSSDAVALFAARARSAGGEFILSGENVAAVAAICRALDGLPLAIELAAARIPAMSPESMLRRLDQRLELLSSGPRDAGERQRTLRATIDWSYELLSPAERALFAGLSVCADGCRLDDAEALFSEIGPLDLLVSLVEKSVLRSRTDPDGEGRYWMLETIKEFAIERLDDSGRRDELRRRHAARYLDVAEAAKSALTGDDQLNWLNRIAADIDNLRLAFAWFAEAGEADGMLRLATALWRALWLRGNLSEGRRWLNTAVAHETAGQGSLEIEALRAAAFLAKWQGDYDDETSLAERALVLARASSDEPGLTATLLSAGQAAVSRSDFERAESLLEESLARARELGHERAIFLALSSLATLSRTTGQLSRARGLFEESLPLIRSVGDRYGTAVCLFGLAFVAIEEHQTEDASPLLVEALGLAIELDYREGIAYFLEGAAAVAAARDDGERAATLLGQMAALHAELGFTPQTDDRRLNARTAEKARAILGEQSFESAFRAGAQMTRDTTIAYASEGLAVRIAPV
jgi:predicted ATPase/class 3 adenylate cyclase